MVLCRVVLPVWFFDGFRTKVKDNSWQNTLRARKMHLPPTLSLTLQHIISTSGERNYYPSIKSCMLRCLLCELWQVLQTKKEKEERCLHPAVTIQYLRQIIIFTGIHINRIKILKNIYRKITEEARPEQVETSKTQIILWMRLNSLFLYKKSFTLDEHDSEAQRVIHACHDKGLPDCEIQTAP